MAADSPQPKKPVKFTTTTKESKSDKPPKPPGNIFSTLRQNISLALIAGILAFGGAVAGGVITNAAQRALWEDEFAYDAEQRIVDMRIDLIERTVMLMSQSYAVQETEKDNIAAALSSVAKVATDPKSIMGLIKKNFREQTVAKCKAISSRKEYTNILKLDQVFFGPKTNRAVEKLLKVDPWWDAKAKDREALIDAMHAEFLEGFKTG